MWVLACSRFLGQGFYLTAIEQQAVELSRKRCVRDGGTPIVQEYEFDEKRWMTHL